MSPGALEMGILLSTKNKSQLGFVQISSFLLDVFYYLQFCHKCLQVGIISPFVIFFFPKTSAFHTSGPEPNSLLKIN